MKINSFYINPLFGPLMALLIALLIPGNTLFAKCLAYNDYFNPCRYPTGDAWCVEYGSGNIFAYKDKCLKEHFPDNGLSIDQLPLTTEINKSYANETSRNYSENINSVDLTEAVLAQSINSANESNKSPKSSSTHDEPGGNLSTDSEQTNSDSGLKSAIAIVVIALFVIKLLGYRLFLISGIIIIIWWVTQHAESFMSLLVKVTPYAEFFISLLVAVTLISLIGYAIFYFRQEIYADKVMKRSDKAKEEAIDKYIHILALKRNQLTFKDEYGDLDVREWEKEKDKFIAKKIMPLSLMSEDNVEYLVWKDRIDHKIDSIKKDETKDNDLRADIEFHNLTPREYELACANELKRYGWSTHVTPLTGDQGADVIASKNDKVIVLQCKYLTTSSVPNKAVQEVHAAKGFNNANYAAVVSNVQYSKSARQLATKLNVELLHHNDLRRLNELITELY